MNRGLSRAMIVVGALLTFGLLLAPTVVTIGASFNPTELTVFPPQGLSLKWYAGAISQFGPAFILSTELGALTALVTIPLAIPAGLAIVRHSFYGKNAIQALLLSPILVPSLLIGMSLFSAFLTFNLQATFVGLLLTHVLLTLPYVVRTVLVSMYGIPEELEECATVLGANPRAVMQHVTVPLLSSGIFGGALFAFLVSFGEINATVFVAGPTTMTVPIQMFSYLEWNSSPVVAAISTLQICLTLVGVAILEKTVGVGKALQFG